eukprot:Rmarinus@m.13771
MSSNSLARRADFQKRVQSSALEDDIDDSPMGEDVVPPLSKPGNQAANSNHPSRDRRRSEWSTQISNFTAPQLTLVASDVSGKACILEVQSVKEFVRQPLPSGALLRCHLTRNKSKGHYALYSCDGEKYIMHAQKHNNNYPVYLDHDQVAHVRSNVMGTEFMILDHDSPTTEVGAVHYDATIIYSSGTPRKMNMILPALTSSKRFEPHRPQMEKDQLMDRFKKNLKPESFIYVQNEAPKWNPKTQMHELKFRNRDLTPSVKNFRAIIKEDGKSRCVLEFAKLRDDKFVVEFMHPISPLQAFTVCLTAIVNKKALV